MNRFPVSAGPENNIRLPHAVLCIACPTIKSLCRFAAEHSSQRTYCIPESMDAKAELAIAPDQANSAVAGHQVLRYRREEAILNAVEPCRYS
ncbi:hypothetical protein OYT13_23790 [Pandoraea sp. XJJ-1]|uniref:hypothetical protein n=1 Tax=Pandoraea sp. XJJ-1 TaxID=3002643 RepID=UPI002281F140|nr:hypothetical protein [Pandoraea sp. XJJ-1]WAL82728.1 hypothetical protein OYT13_23790 [Pandoraea sp. XJJ-1]